MEFFSQDPAMFMNFGMIFFMFLIFYFFVIRPQKKSDQKREFFQSNLKKGDKVVTAGGIYGTIASVGSEKISLKVAENVDIEILRGAITRFQDTTKQELLNQEFNSKK